MAPRISVQPRALSELADELTGLAAELAEDADRCRAVAGSVAAALGGWEGVTAGQVVSTWSVLAGTLAEGTAAAAGVLRSAGTAYRAAEEELARVIGVPPC